ncbi:hypothetical protein F4809DRAFT_619978 [Biscogniauxia mediterranea]|nr:hypothetical protein F4809DRAFT_619978 [Biscogniauxia mediterranea]
MEGLTDIDLCHLWSVIIEKQKRKEEKKRRKKRRKREGRKTADNIRFTCRKNIPRGTSCRSWPRKRLTTFTTYHSQLPTLTLSIRAVDRNHGSYRITSTPSLPDDGLSYLPNLLSYLLVRLHDMTARYMPGYVITSSSVCTQQPSPGDRTDYYYYYLLPILLDRTIFSEIVFVVRRISQCRRHSLLKTCLSVCEPPFDPTKWQASYRLYVPMYR